MQNHAYFLQKAVDLAQETVQQGIGGPFGSLVVKENQVISKGYNCVTSLLDPTAHAEVQAIRLACKNLKIFQLTGCILYSSCEPCPMCFGAIYWARLQAVYFASTRQDASSAGFEDNFIYRELELSLQERSIPFIQIALPSHQEVFLRWKEKPNKISY